MRLLAIVVCLGSAVACSSAPVLITVDVVVFDAVTLQPICDASVVVDRDFPASPRPPFNGRGCFYLGGKGDNNSNAPFTVTVSKAGYVAVTVSTNPAGGISRVAVALIPYP